MSIKKQRTTSTSKQTRESARQKWLNLNQASDLQIVERLLRESIDAKETQAEERLSTDALCLLLCQQSRDQESVVLMKKLNYVARLSKQVLHYNLPTTNAVTKSTTSSTSSSFDPSSTPLRVFDNALQPDTLARLQATFCNANCNYWTEHNYEVYPPSPYFSFVVPLTPTIFQELGALGNLLSVIVSKTAEHFGGVEYAKYIELWAHRRPHASGHQLHFDSDNEGRGGVRNPLVSTVLYLSDEGCGGPTLVTDQHIDGDALAQTGWMAFPKENRLVIFDGAVLHGVIPGRGFVESSKTRTTLMIALWDDIRIRTGDEPGAARPFPTGGKGGDEKIPEWCESLTGKLEKSKTKTAEGKVNVPELINSVQVNHVWTDLEDQEIGSSKPHYDKVFQGF